MPGSPESPPPRRRRWFRISLRGLMVMVLVVGGGIGWEVNRVRTQRLAVAAIQAEGGSVLYDYQFSTDPERMKVVRKNKEPAAPALLRRWLGDDFFQTAVAVRLPVPVHPEVLEAVSRLDGLVSLHVVESLGLEASWPALERLTRLEEVNLSDPGVNDLALATIARLPALWSVSLFSTQVSDGSLLALAAAPRLRRLKLGFSPQLTDAGVARVLTAGMPELEEFSFSHTSGPIPLTVQALADHHSQLRMLALIQGNVADADLAPIGALTALTNLNLQQTLVTDAGLVHLAPLQKLEFLTISLPGVTDEGMKTVGRLVNLVTLSLSWSQVDDPGLAELKRLQKLKTLLLLEAPVTDHGAELLGQLGALEALNLDHTKLTDRALGPLATLAKLRILSVGGTAITPAGVAQFRSARPTTTVNLRPVRAKLGPPPLPPN